MLDKLEIGDTVYLGWHHYKIVAFCEDPNKVWVSNTRSGLVWGKSEEEHRNPATFVANIDDLSSDIPQVNKPKPFVPNPNYL